MTEIKIFQVDAFAVKLFTGNPAAVCPLEYWLDDSMMQNIAMENNLAETAFYVNENGNYHIRWFTPSVEVDLCGHATLASAHVLFHHQSFSGNQIAFQSRSGPLTVKKSGERLTLNFPVDTLIPGTKLPEFEAALGIMPIEVFQGKTDYLLVFENEDQIKSMQPDMRLISKLKARGVIVTAKGDTVDFVSRFFAPQSGVDEDPVTGSAHTTLTPYWSKVLNKTELSAVQLSRRGGRLNCKMDGARAEISGKAQTFMVGSIFLPL